MIEDGRRFFTYQACKERPVVPPMSVSLLPSLLPFALAVAGAGLAGLVGRLLGRAELGDRLAGLGIVLGLGAGWLWLGGPAV
ncbi:MAG TPA: hypothetical protein DEV96_15500, partial [Rhodospirillum rubrum]|nr:hypothetical protein [Rhodospirillum rubrum]